MRGEGTENKRVKIDIERKGSNLSRSAWIKMHLENALMKNDKTTLGDIKNEIRELKETIKNRERI